MIQMPLDSRVKCDHVAGAPIVAGRVEVEPPILREELDYSAGLATAY